MNKHERHLIKMKKFKRRMMKFKPEDRVGDLNGYRNHSTPCSCWICRGEKYSRKQKHKIMNKDTMVGNSDFEGV